MPKFLRKTHLHAFDFVSPVYSRAFLVGNSQKLVNLTPEGRAILESSIAEQHQAIDAARAQVRVVREDDEYVRLVTKLEAVKGPAGRRAVLEAGLRTLTRADLRDKLMLEASRIEVQAALDKAETLKSPAAKLRTLEAALELVRADGVPDELQAQQIRWLEQAIAETRAAAG